jgi:hypothetical protein
MENLHKMYEIRESLLLMKETGLLFYIKFISDCRTFTIKTSDSGKHARD